MSLPTGSNSEGTEYRTVSQHDAAGVQNDDGSRITGGCFPQPAIHLSNLNGEIAEQRFRPMDRRIDQLLDSTERVLRHPSVGQMPTGLTPGSSIAASGNKRFHFTCSQGGAGKRKRRNQRVRSSAQSAPKAKDWNTREVQILLVESMTNELFARPAAGADIRASLLSPRSFDLFEAIVFFRNVDYDYRSWWGKPGQAAT